MIIRRVHVIDSKRSSNSSTIYERTTALRGASVDVTFPVKVTLFCRRASFDLVSFSHRADVVTNLYNSSKLHVPSNKDTFPIESSSFRLILLSGRPNNNRTPNVANGPSHCKHRKSHFLINPTDISTDSRNFDRRSSVPYSSNFMERVCLTANTNVFPIRDHFFRRASLETADIA